MSAHIDSYQEILAFNSGSDMTSYFECGADELISLQITKTTTGSFSAMRIETSNWENPFTKGPRTGSVDNGLWCLEEGPHSASLLTASNSQASVMHQLGNVGSRFIRTVITPGAGDVFRIVWHGKGPR